MRKLNIIIGSMLLAVFLMNTAAAVAISGLPNGEIIDRGEMVTYTIAITEATDANGHTVEMSGLDAFDVTIDGTPVAAWSWNDTFDGTGITYTVNVTNNAAPNGNYKLRIIVDEDSTEFNEGSITVNLTAIPEFPTIALPIAAILGLAFIFQRRKEEE